MASTAPASAFLGARDLSRSQLLAPASTSQLRIASSSASGASLSANSDRHGSRLQVVARKRRSLAEKFGRQQPGPMPQVDAGDDDPKFVIFIKTKNVNIWYPLSMVSGGTTAKVMVQLMKWDLGKRLYGGTLTRNMGAVVYKDERAIQQTAVKQYPMLKGASGFEYGYKMVDPANPKASVSGSGVIKIPPQEELKSVVDKAKDALDSITKGFSLPALGQGSTEGSQEPKK